MPATFPIAATGMPCTEHPVSSVTANTHASVPAAQPFLRQTALPNYNPGTEPPARGLTMKRRLVINLTALTLLAVIALSSGGCNANNAMCDWANQDHLPLASAITKVVMLCAW